MGRVAMTILVLLIAVMAGAAFLPGSPREPLLAGAAVLLILGLVVTLTQVPHGRSRTTDSTHIGAIRGTVGLSGGPRAQVRLWSALPEAEGIRTVREWMASLFNLPEHWRLEALELVALAVHYLPDADRARVTAMRAKALEMLSPPRRAALIDLHRAVIRRLPGRLRWQEEDVLSARESTGQQPPRGAHP